MAKKNDKQVIKKSTAKNQEKKNLLLATLFILIFLLIAIIAIGVYYQPETTPENNTYQPPANNNNNNNNYVPVNNVPQDYLEIISHKQTQLVLNLVIKNKSDEAIGVKKVVLNSIEKNSKAVINPGETLPLGINYTTGIPGIKYFYSKETSYFVIEVNGVESVEYFENDLEGTII